LLTRSAETGRWALIVVASLSLLILGFSFWRQISVLVGPVGLTVERGTSRLLIERRPLFVQWGLTVYETRQLRGAWWFRARTESGSNWSLDLFLPGWFVASLALGGYGIAFCAHRRPNAARCFQCGYSLVGLLSPKLCPECGATLARDAGFAGPPAQQPRRCSLVAARALHFLAAALMIAIILSVHIQAEWIGETNTAFLRRGGIELISGRLSYDPGYSLMFGKADGQGVAWWLRRDSIGGYARSIWPLWPMVAALGSGGLAIRVTRWLKR
jgi:hypothetical protein